MNRKPINIRSRIDALEQRRRDLLPHPVCEVCGGPKPGDNMDTQVNEKGEPMWGVCPACGLWLDHNGKPRAAIPRKPGDPPWVPQPWGPNMPWD